MVGGAWYGGLPRVGALVCLCCTICQLHTFTADRDCDGLSPTSAPAFVWGGGVLALGYVGALTWTWVGVAGAAANRATIAAAGGVEAIVQGMQAHVGVAAVQEDGTGALGSLASNGALLHHLWWHCVVRGAWLAAAGQRVLFVCFALSATCTRWMQRHRHGLTPTCATAAACGGAVPGPGHVGY